MQYANTKRYKIEWCGYCHTNTKHRRVWGEYLPCKAYRCCLCEFEIVIYTAPA